MKGAKRGRSRMRKKQDRRQKFFPYMAELCVIAVVVTVAFFLPQIIFRVQDNLRWNDTTLGQRESMNVESLSTTYEVSLGKRMRKFAEGLAKNQNFYLTSQELTVDNTLSEYLYSEKGLYWELIRYFVEDNLIPVEIWWKEDDYGYSVVRWKQYVIYNDNYEEGVNFILWYIEMQDRDGAALKLLADAEDGTIYGLKAEGSNHACSSFGYDHVRSLIRYGDSAVQVWSYCAVYYEAMSEELESTLSLAERLGYNFNSVGNEYDAIEEEAGILEKELGALGMEDMEGQLRKLFQYKLETEGRTCFLLPFGETVMDAVVDIEEQDNQEEILFPDVTIGIRQIYELIPEFA